MLDMMLEIPTKYLKWWSPFCDGDFVLAHQVLADPVYSEFFATRPATREVLLDNSMHELGRALPITDLLRAAKLCKATYIIPPDKLGEPIWNEQQFHETFATFKDTSVKIGVVMTGRTEDERRQYLRSTSSASMLLLPYRESRLDWFREQRQLILSRFYRIHLLGVNTLQELETFVRISEDTPDVHWSVDTAKPIKHGVAHRRINDGESLRGAKTTSYDLLNLSGLSPRQVGTVEANIQILRKICSGSAERRAE